MSMIIDFIEIINHVDREETYYWFDVFTDDPAYYSGRFAVVDCGGDFNVQDANGEIVSSAMSAAILERVDQYEYN